MSDISICNAEISISTIDPSPYSDVVSFDAVLRVRAVAAARDFSPLNACFMTAQKQL